MSRTALLGRPIGVFAWLGLSLVGFVVGFMLVFEGGWVITEVITGDAERLFDSDGWFFWLTLTTGFVLGGAGLATSQWLLLRRHVAGPGRWIGGMALGTAILAVLYLALYDLVPLTLNEFTHNVVAGLVIGLVQLPVVRQLGDHTRRWPVVTIVALASGAALSALMVHGFGYRGDQGGILGMALYGLITGVVLTRWTARATSREPTIAASPA
jgi:hypothetical protein